MPPEKTMDYVSNLELKLEEAEKAVHRIRKLHQSIPARYYGTDLNPNRRYDCSACGEGRAWPCKTIRALNGSKDNV